MVTVSEFSFLQPFIFFLSHDGLIFFCLVLVTQQMQHTMNHHTMQFIFKSGVKFFSVRFHAVD